MKKMAEDNATTTKIPISSGPIGSLPTKRIAIIGAGASGVTAARQCLDQGLEIVVFEKTTYTGGLWRYQPTVDEKMGVASVMRSTIINTSKELTAFSDFPAPDESPNYMHHSKMAEYLDLYGAQFNFLSYVKFRHEIISVEQAPDYPQTGRWAVTYVDLGAINNNNNNNLLNSNEDEEEGTGEQKKPQMEIFDGVMICSGNHSTPHMPVESFPGVDKFRGRVMHSHSLKSSKGFEDKRVCVIGCGNSGGDAAVELSTVTSQMYLSTRRGQWVIQRVYIDGLPSDSYYQRRITIFILNLLPVWLSCTFLEWYQNFFINHELFQLKPKHRLLQQHGFFNDALPNRILSGTVQIKGDVDRFTEEGVVFKGETEATPLDVVIFATGYKIDYPFLSQKLLPTLSPDGTVHLYKLQFIPSLTHPETLAIIGLGNPFGSILPVSELQSRWFALLNCDNAKLKLPTREQMERNIQKAEARTWKRYYRTARHALCYNWLPYVSNLARHIHAYPPLFRYFFTDPLLWWALVIGPSAPYQFRLVGPNRWAGARSAMLSVHKRMLAGIQTNKGREPSKNCVTSWRTPTVVGFLSFIVFGGTFVSAVLFTKFALPLVGL